MRPTLLIFVLMSIVPLSACADDPTASSETAANPPAEQIAKEKDGSEPDSSVASSKGDGPRTCDPDRTFQESSYLCISLENEGLTFKVLAKALAKRSGLSEEEFLAFNGWDEEYLAQPVEPGVSYLYQLPYEAYVRYVNDR